VQDYGARGDGHRDDTAAVEAAMAAAARAHGVLYLPAGVYLVPKFTVANGIEVKGDGIYKPTDKSGTWVKGTLLFGSHDHIHDLKVGDTGTSGNRQRAHATLFERVRFAGGEREGGDVLFLGKYAQPHDPVVDESCYDVTWQSCEFERPHVTNARLLSAGGMGSTVLCWDDWRKGGTRIHDLRFIDCHFGVKNGPNKKGSDGKAQNYGCGWIGFLVQASPNEYTTPYGVSARSAGFDWSKFDHLHHDILLKDCIFEQSYWTTADFTDFARAYGLSKWNENPMTPDKLPLVPNEVWGRRMDLQGCVLKGGGLGNAPGSPAPYAPVTNTVIYELGKDCLVTGNVVYAGMVTQSPLTISSASYRVVASGNVTKGGLGHYTPSPYDP
jgi:hypothetical protein